MQPIVAKTSAIVRGACSENCCTASYPDCTACGTKPADLNRSKEYVGIFDIFKVGVGPSSSHTMGPMWAGKRFATLITKQYPSTALVQIHLYGSLALTGKGHATDKATVLGLAGFQPDTINPDSADDTYNQIIETKQLMLDTVKPLIFDYEKDLVFHYDLALPLHPNGMTLRAFDNKGTLIKEVTYYSVGGGFIKTESEMLEGSNSPRSIGDDDETNEGDDDEDDESSVGCYPLLKTSQSSPSSPPQRDEVPYHFRSATELIVMAKAHCLTIADLMVENECVLKSLTRDQVYANIDSLANVMDTCVERGLRMEGSLPVTNAPRRASQIRRRLNQNMERSLNDPLTISDWIALYARAVNEENACGGRVVTAPTNGASGTLPAVLTYYRRTVPTATKQGVRDFIATAAAIGSLCKRNASISGAEAGCQAEVGSACAMAAAGLTAVLGGTLEQIENAAEIGLEHCLGMTCDPILGLVQIPCIERNCVAAIKAVMACRLAMMGDGNHEVSLDSCIETMYRTGLDMQAQYRETSTGGLAVFAKKSY